MSAINISQGEKDPTNALRAFLLAEMDSTINELNNYKQATATSAYRNAYQNSRQHYKYIEFLTCELSPYDVKYHINGPLIFKHDLEITGDVHPPNGFQLLEEESYSQSTRKERIKTADELLIHLKRLRKYYTHCFLDEVLILEAIQLQVYRIVSLGLNGFDATYVLNNSEEAIHSLSGMKSALMILGKTKKLKGQDIRVLKNTLRELERAMDFLKQQSEYETIDRLEFIIKHANEINKCLIELNRSLDIGWSNRGRALLLTEEFIFGPNAMNMDVFSPFRGEEEQRRKMADLGKVLFFDPILSGNGERSCASCHKPELAFTDGLAKSTAADQKAQIGRNAPSLVNVAFQQKFFYDGRVFQLERQVFDVIQNHFEMDGEMENLVDLLRSSKVYREMFREAYRGRLDTAITRNAIQKAIAEYERSLVAMNSKFDRYLRGERGALNERERNGYNLFAGKALCGSCHFFPIFNGTIPPEFMDTEFEVLGVSETSDEQLLDEDMGRYAVTHEDIHRHSFKTPTVRNVEFTSPYMHNGVYSSLEEVVEFYHQGGGSGLGLEVPNQTLPFDSLQLSNTEKEDIVLFMKALSDTTGMNSKVNALPIIEGHSELNNRKIGGKY